MYARSVALSFVLAVASLFGDAVAQSAVTDSCARIWSASVPPPELLTAMRAQYKGDLATLDAKYDKELREALKEDWTSLQEDLLEHLEDEYFLFGTPMNALVDSVVRVIVEANPQVRMPRVLLSWYSWPNASCRGEGTVVVDLGLLERLNTKAELAFVLAHELAHQQLDHVGNSILKVNQRLQSEDFKAEVAATMRQEYNRVAALEKLYVGFSLNERRHSRTHEAEADAMALEFLMETDFDPTAALSVMDVLDRCDGEVDPFPVDVRTAFAQGTVVYADAWMEPLQRSSLAGVDTRDHALDDSLRTHPECMARKALLAAEFQREPKELEAQRAAYAPTKRMATLQLVESSFQFGNVGRAIHLALQGLKEDPPPAEAAYLEAALARGLTILYRAYRDHVLSQTLEHLSKDQSESYARTLHVLHALRMSEFLSLAEHYLAQAQAHAPDCEETLYATALMAHAKKTAAELEQARTAYTTAFPTGRHTKKLEKLTLTEPSPKRAR